jgi:hypothetical protein
MLPIFLLDASCSFGGTLQQNWVSISMFVAVIALMGVGIIYMISNMLNSSMKEKFKALARFEIFQIMLSIIIIFLIIAFSMTACSITSTLSQSLIGTAESPFNFADYYVGSLLFSNGLGLITQAYSISINYAITAHMISLISSFTTPYLSKLPWVGATFSFPATTKMFTARIGMSQSFAEVYLAYSGLFSMLSDFVLVTFAALLVMWLILPVIHAIALVILIPIALIMRMISFEGPNLRNIANSIIAISLAFYFVLPLTFVFNSYAMGWMFCNNGINPCNPYPQYVGQYTENNIQVNELFNSTNVTSTLGGLANTNINIFSSILSGMNFFGSSGYMSNLFSILDAPASVDNYSNQVAQYLFQGIVLMALDLAITIGFAMGIAKSFNAVSEFMGDTGSFWGGV